MIWRWGEEMGVGRGEGGGERRWGEEMGWGEETEVGRGNMEAGRGDGGGERRWGEEMGVVRGDVEVGRGDGMGKGDGAIAGSDTVGKLWGGGI